LTVSCAAEQRWQLVSGRTYCKAPKRLSVGAAKRISHVRAASSCAAICISLALLAAEKQKRFSPRGTHLNLLQKHNRRGRGRLLFRSQISRESGHNGEMRSVACCKSKKPLAADQKVSHLLVSRAHTTPKSKLELCKSTPHFSPTRKRDLEKKETGARKHRKGRGNFCRSIKEKIELSE
jgi:hypothetical protein